MELSNYFRLAVYFCLIMIIFTLAVDFVSSLGIFTPVDSGVDLTTPATDVAGRSSGIFGLLSPTIGSMASFWAILLTLEGIGAIVVAKLVGSTNIIGVYLFSVTFWGAFIRCLTVVNIGSYLPIEFITMFVVGIFFVWIASVISMMTSVS